MGEWIETFDDAQIIEIHALMTEEWWCSDRSVDEVRKVVAGSDLTLAAIDENQRIAAFARVLSDGIFKAVLFDVIVKEEYRGTRLGERLINKLKLHPSLKQVKSLELYCPDRISGFYTKLGFDISESKLHQFAHTTQKNN